MSISLQRYSDRGVCVIRVDGDIDIGVVPHIQERLTATLESGCTNIVFDLSQVTYADSSALGLLVWLDHQLGPVDGRVVLSGANKDVTRVFELAGLHVVTPTVAASPTVEAALERFHRGAEPAIPRWTESFDVVADVEHLADARSRVCSLIVPLGVTDSWLFDVKVAVGEALANAVRHGSPAGAEDSVDIGVTAYDDRIVITVADHGGGFDGAAACGQDVYAASGRGIIFMRALMDSVDFSPCNAQGTVVTLVKHLPVR